MQMNKINFSRSVMIKLCWMSIIYAATIFPLLFKEREGRKILFDDNIMRKYMWSVFRKVEVVEKKHNV